MSNRRSSLSKGQTKKKNLLKFYQLDKTNSSQFQLRKKTERRAFWPRNKALQPVCQEAKPETAPKVLSADKTPSPQFPATKEAERRAYCPQKKALQKTLF
ncbi:hypothetical protein JTE90_002552 [Oedothorax gibbosus]|uniref:Uncharacterized protein n=1 Tax=Oedothorax gibbosus TaxID=931172 RepID=A0AAV6V2E0_9ARAC|nr:hypothetical protein JTE90_002552 [Oedothorax gibbosus]